LAVNLSRHGRNEKPNGPFRAPESLAAPQQLGQHIGN
jgi:hypothetical protein